MSKARENASDHVLIGVTFASYWLRGWYEFTVPIIERSKEIPVQSWILSKTIKNISNIQSLFFFSWTEASRKTRKLNRTKPASTHLFLKKGLKINKKYCTKALNDRSSCQTSSSVIAPRLYHYSCNSCMTLICITVAITTTTECLFEGLFKLRIHYPIDDWIC